MVNETRLHPRQISVANALIQDLNFLFLVTWLVYADYLPFNAKIELKLLVSLCVPIFGKSLPFLKKKTFPFLKKHSQKWKFSKNGKNTIVCLTDEAGVTGWL